MWEKPASWIVHVKQELQTPASVTDDGETRMPFIKRVPAPLHAVRPSAYTPQTLALGAFHRRLIIEGDYAFSFADMEEFKLIVAKQLALSTQSSSTPGGLIASLVEEIGKQKKEVRACFGKEMGLEGMSSEELCYVLAIDCIFIVAMMQCMYNELHAGVDPGGEARRRWAAPPCFSRLAPPLKKAALLDLLLLENQVPLFLVKKTMQMMSGGHDDVESSWQALVDIVAYRALPFCKGVRAGLQGPGARTANKHLLDCLYSVVTCNVEEDDWKKLHPHHHDPLLQGDELQQGLLCVVPTASQLRQAGVQFKGHPLSLSHITFHHRTLTLPIIHVGDETERIFRNLLAHESQLACGRPQVASYLHFMNSLINTADDVAVLVEAGVISESIGDYKHVARLWNQLATNTDFIFRPRYSHVAGLAKAYVEAEIHGVMAELRERYFSRPWLLLSLLSGTALLIMTFLTMWYTIEVYLKA